MIVLIPYINLLNLSWIIKMFIFEEYGPFNFAPAGSRYSSSMSQLYISVLFCYLCCISYLLHVL